MIDKIFNMSDTQPKSNSKESKKGKRKERLTEREKEREFAPEVYRGRWKGNWEFSSGICALVNGIVYCILKFSHGKLFSP